MGQPVCRRPAHSFVPGSGNIYRLPQDQWFSQYLTGHLKALVLPGMKPPLDQCQSETGDFDAGDPIGGDTASGVQIGTAGGTGNGVVGMAGDQQTLMFTGPPGEPLFGLFLQSVVPGGAGGIWNAQSFQRLPEITNQEAGQLPQSTV